jgi:AsmA protein
MRPKRSSVPAGFPSASASSTKDALEEQGKHFLTMAVQTLPDLYKRLVQKLDLANLTSTTKRNLKVGGIVLLALLVVLVALPFLINVNRFRPKIESEVTNALGRPVTLGNLSLSILTGTVSVGNINIADDPAFSKSPFIAAKSVKVGVELMPLIFSKQLNVTGIVLDEPQITLLKSASGTWNVSSLGGASAKKSPEPAKSGASQAVSIAKLQIKDGKLTIGEANSTAKPQVYDNLNIQMTNFSSTSQFPFQLTLNLPGGGSANVSGNAGPINPQDAAKTPFDATMNVKDMDIAASGFVDPASGIGGSVDFNGSVNSNGSQAKVAGSLSCEKLKLSPNGSPAPKVVSVKYAVDTDLDRQAGTVTQGDIAIGKTAARLTGGFQTQGETQVLNLKLSAPDMSVDELESMLPALGVVLPSGSQLKGGTLSAELAISGPFDKLVVVGPVRMSNTKLAGFDMDSKLGALSAFSGKSSPSPDTTIQNASLNARIAPEMTRADAINVTIPSLGVLTGTGTISPAGALDFSMVADLETGRSGLRADRTGRGGDRGGVPFKIQGTTSNPTFVPEIGSVAGDAAKGAIQKSATDKTAGILGRRKPK